MKLSVIRIGPRRLYDEKAIDRAIRNVLKASAEDAETDFQRTVATFNKKPKFAVKEESDYSWLVSTDDQIYYWLTYGTKPHAIVARNANTLAFQANYQRKSIPNVIASRHGGASGPMVYKREVWHPGTEATNHDKRIAERWGRKLPRRMMDSLSVYL